MNWSRDKRVNIKIAPWLQKTGQLWGMAIVRVGLGLNEVN